MPLTSDEVASRFPIHWLVWNNKHEELKEALESNKFSKEDIERHDNRGRTPLLLAVTLGHIESVQVLIDANADVNCEKDGWTAVQEATATGNPALLSLVLSRRDYQRYVVQSSGIPELLNKLSLAPDFYVEMKWEFTSWVPLVSRMCPFDTYKVYKRGANVRVDTTLVGFENNRWQRGDRTYIFRGQGSSASLVELDHEAGTSGCEYFEVGGERGARGWPPPPPHVLEQRLAAPLAINYLDTDKISFERNKSGIWGWRQDKSESVNGYECKVFSANNVELVSKTRSEHLPRGERRAHAPRAPLAGLLALADGDDSAAATPASSPLLTPDRVSCNNVELVSKTRSEHLPRGERRAHAPRAPLAGLLALADGDDSAAATPASSPLLTPDRVSCNNVELVSKTRSEHLPRGERRAHAPRAPLAGLLALADGDDSAAATPASSPLLTPDRVSCNNVELVSKTRSEHLPRGERRAHAPRAPLAGLLALADGDDSAAATPASSPLLTPDRVSYNNVELVSKTRSEHLPRGERRAHAPRAPLAGLLALADGDDSAAATPASSPLLTPDRVSCNNVELVSKTRSEHLPRGERRAHAPRAPLAGLLALADGDDSAAATPASSPLLTPDRVSCNNVELVSKTRSEHLPRGERRAHAPRAPLAGLLALADGDDSAAATPASSPLLTPDRVSCNNVELVSKTRSEHLPRGERRAHAPRAPLAGLLALADGDDSAAATPASSPLLTPDRVSCNNVELVSKTRSEHLPRGERRAHAPRAPLAGLLALADGDDSAAATPASSPLLTPDRVSCNNVELVSKTRSEHLPRGERRAHAPRAPLAGLLALADGDDSAAATPASSPLLTPDREEPPKRSRSREDLRPAAPVTWEEYFSDEPLDKEIGRPRDIATKVQKFRATLWLCEDYPLELQEQIMPILDLMASISSPHFAKLKDFIQMQLPAGFPVKIEIPLFHVLNARITFGNIFATETPVPHVECIQEGERLSCVVDDQCFDVGRGYRDAAAPDERLGCDDDEGLLQYAIQQSLMDAGTHDDQVDVWEALRSARSTSPVPPRARTTPHLLLDNEDTHLQRAIEASLTNAPLDLRVPDADANVGADDADELDADLRAALAISAREQAALDQQLQDEQKALDEVLRLSLLEK